ncbi:MAG: lysophospholipid acyltransferase family protein [Pseudomonadota bacterium]
MSGKRVSKHEKRQRRRDARDITYAAEAETRSGRAMIRVMENATGRLSLMKRANGYAEEVRRGGNFWEIMVQRYGVTLDIVGGSLDNIPRHGPVVVVANHPYGILDGLILGYVMSRARGDFRILANRVFRRAADLDRIILPISFEATKEATALNIATRKTSLHYLSQGGAIGVFPGGTVSTAAKPFARPMDPNWRSFTARMIAKSEAQVVPIFFEGQNSRLFQMASRMHATLRTGLFIKEFKKGIKKPVRMVVGEPIPRAEINAYRADARAMMDFLRERTYALSPEPLDASQIGFEFEGKAGNGPRMRDWY